jgi:succinate dehydrogenase hydrophobic anchor subunit
MFKNHAIEWIFLRLTAIWSIFSLFFFIYLFVLNVKNTNLDVFNCTSLFQIFWDAWASPNLNGFGKSFLFFSLILLAYHMFSGLVTILQDYVHNDKTKYFGEILILIAIIETLKHFYIFIFF